MLARALLTRWLAHVATVAILGAVAWLGSDAELASLMLAACSIGLATALLGWSVTQGRRPLAGGLLAAVTTSATLAAVLLLSEHGGGWRWWLAPGGGVTLACIELSLAGVERRRYARWQALARRDEAIAAAMPTTFSDVRHGIDRDDDAYSEKDSPR